MSYKPWIICVFIDSLDETLRALNDLRHQSVKPHLLAIDNGSSLENWTSVRRWARNHDRVWLWRHNPSLASLSMTWNLALEFVWSMGAEEALVVNHDVRVHRLTYELLSTTAAGEAALFVSAVGVMPDQFKPEALEKDLLGEAAKGGPDFSCFLISKACHGKYRFDENFTPAYCEDLDFHRRMLLGGDGKRIFSINVPFAHEGSGVLRSKTPEERAKLQDRIGEGSRAYYEKKWGGPVNHEAFWHPFDEGGPFPGIQSTLLDLPEAENAPTTPNLQRHYGP